MELRDLFSQNNNIRFLCGAGISRDSGMPVVNNYLETLFKETGFNDYEIGQLLTRELPFEFWIEEYQKFNPDFFIELIRIYSNNIFVPNKNHLLLSLIIKSNICNEIYTTNFDQLLEKSLKSQNIEFSLCYEDNHFKAITNSINRIIKLHGTAENVDSICTTIKNIAQKRYSDDFKNIITNMISYEENVTLVILGYSCSDIFDICPIIEQYNLKHVKVIYIEHSTSEEPSFSPLNKIWPIKSDDINDGVIISMDTTEFLISLCCIYRINIANLEITQNLLSIPPLSSFFKDYFSNVSREDKLILQAELLHASGLNEVAISLFSKLLEENPAMQYLDNRLINVIGRCYQSIGMHDKSNNFHENQLYTNLYQIGILNNRLDYILLGTKDYISIMEFLLLEKNNYILKDEKNYYAIIDPLFGLVASKTELNPHESIKALDLLRKISEFNNDLKDEKLLFISKIENELGIALLKTGKYKEAIVCLEESIMKKKRIGDLMSMSNSLNNTIQVYLKLNNYSKAWKNGIECLQIRKKLNHEPKIVETLINLFALGIDMSSIKNIAYLYFEVIQSLNETNQGQILKYISKTIVQWMMDHNIEINKLLFQLKKDVSSNNNFKIVFIEIAHSLYSYSLKYINFNKADALKMLTFARDIYKYYELNNYVIDINNMIK